MKSVIYHANSSRAIVQTDYEALFRGFVENAHAHGIRVVHLTTYGQPGWGDENEFCGLDPHNIVFNRELVFYQFLTKVTDDEVYWFTEPDARITQSFPEPEGDLVLLFRPEDDVPITPSFRLARKTALPFFKETEELALKLTEGLDWHGDSGIFNEMWKRMGKPEVGVTQYNGMTIELRPYKQYNGHHNNDAYVQHFKYKNKRELLNQERVR